jgi:hypothetical protein
MMHAAVPLSFCYYCEGKPTQNRVFARLIRFNRSPVPVDRIASKELSAHNWSALRGDGTSRQRALAL